MSLDTFQQVFALSFASNVLFDVNGSQDDLQAAFQLALRAALPTIDPEWKVVWGPMVWKHEPDNKDSGPDNSWYIAYHPRFVFEDGSSHPTYVISVAGTPKDSLYVWFKQNFAVNNVVNFGKWVENGIQNRPEIVPPRDVVAGREYIATGIAEASHLLLTTPAPDSAESAGQTLFDFVGAVRADPSSPPRFITTGVSLGSAISSTLALALVRSQTIPIDSTTLTYPVAGPSPGNVYFTKSFKETFPSYDERPKAYQGWNRNLVNTLDVIPQAWCSWRFDSPEQNLFNIPRIYGIPAQFLVKITTLLGIFWSRTSGVRYQPLPSQFIAGPITPTPTSFEEFMMAVWFQHGIPYYTEIGVPLSVLDGFRVTGPGIKEKTEDEKRFNLPFIDDLEWAREHPEEAKEIGDEVGKTDEGKEASDELEDEDK